MTMSEESGVRTDYCAACGEWISVWIIEADPQHEEGGVWVLSKTSGKGAGTVYADGKAYHGLVCQP